MTYEDFVVLIPAVNEEQVLGGVITELKKSGFSNILVINDGSTDKTKEVALDNGAVVISHAINIGYGGATITGINFILAKNKFGNCKYLITVDGDGQHNVKDVEGVANKILEGYDFVIGSRVMTTANSPIVKIVLNHFADILAFIITGKYVRGIYSGLKAIKIEKLNLIKLNLKDYSFSAEFAVEAIHNGLKVETYNIQSIYTEYSKTKPVKLHISKTLKFAKDLMN